jgi:protein tyrosine phosphatase (PTP) superfamily phosphohydrolase (DUF442 family)
MHNSTCSNANKTSRWKRVCLILYSATWCIGVCLGNYLLADDAGETRLELTKLSATNLPNAFRITENILSGGLPEGSIAFEELRQLGVRTIISVDGAKPDVEIAEKFGMRYVHLPHGYDGIGEERILQIAKAVQELPGPVYIHCHHGKHRSPAAAAVAAISLQLVSREQAIQVLATVGTSPEYRGLYESVRNARPRTPEEIQAIPSDFPCTAKLPELAESMVAMERTLHRLQLAQKTGWSMVASDPDIDPAHQALLLRELCTELLRTDSVKKLSKNFEDLMQQAETQATALEESLRGPNARKTENHPTLTTLLNAVQDNCTSCHRQFRDIPLSEKTNSRK